MAFDEGLAARLRELLEGEPGVAERRMFGGLAIMLDGNMAVGIQGSNLLVRVPPADHEVLLAEPGADVFDFTGRVAKGMIVVDESVCAEDGELRRWVERGVAFARSLPPK